VKRGGFTLVEVLGVTVIVAVLAGIALGVVRLAQERANLTKANCQLLAIAAALEMYRSDQGYYPRTTPVRISAKGYSESTNNWLLYRALTGPATGRIYLKFPANQIRAYSDTLLTNIVDPWDLPYNYYCSPGTALAVSNPAGVNSGFAFGGQVNASAYDLFSYGPDKVTYVPGATSLNNTAGAWRAVGWTTSGAAVDDLTYR
jgi:prepilin-type N-terminal cleavage/methylation domain-containing protein